MLNAMNGIQSVASAGSSSQKQFPSRTQNRGAGLQHYLQYMSLAPGTLKASFPLYCAFLRAFVGSLAELPVAIHWVCLLNPFQTVG